MGWQTRRTPMGTPTGNPPPTHETLQPPEPDSESSRKDSKKESL